LKISLAKFTKIPSPKSNRVPEISNPFLSILHPVTLHHPASC